MRFSLLTLLLLVFWIGAALLVWERREPWIKGPDQRGLAVSDTPMRLERGGRCIRHGHYVCGNFVTPLITVTEAPPNYRNTLWELYATTTTNDVLVAIDEANVRTGKDILDSKHYVRLDFVDDNTIQFQLRATDPVQTFHRRHPEWWWGHFHRPEVWLAIALTGALIWRARRALGAAKSVATQKAALQ